MLALDKKSYRGILVEDIVKSCIANNLFGSIDQLKEILQEQLNSNLKFKTIVSNIETKNGHTFGKVFFDCEDGNMRAIDFTIVNEPVTV